MVPSSIGPYRIIEGLGSGANGEVYLAEDVRLGRKVAVKTLSALDSQDLVDVRRWVLREARAAARLNHPNIASVYDVIESPGGAHIVMEYVRGDTLAVRLRQGGPLPPAQVVEIGIQLADALAEAHAMGVVHRDLKPSNAVITAKGSVKILDFGLARVRVPESPSGPPGSSSPDFTLEGRQVGTPPYMPPEHLLGDPFDARGDIYSLGVTLFELVTGRRPFSGANAMALTMAIVHEPTPHARDFGPAVPDALDAVVFRAMARLPEDRYASASAVRTELERIPATGSTAFSDAPTRSGRQRAALPRSGGATSVALAGLALAALVVGLGTYGSRRGSPSKGDPASPVVAVLPLSGAAGDAQAESLATGTADSLISSLSKVTGLAVVSRQATLPYRERKKDTDTIARELGATMVVDGAVQRAGDKVRLTLTVLRPGSKVVQWTNTYDGNLGEVFALQTEVAEAVTDTLRLRLSPEDRRAVEKPPTRNVEAFADYAQGRTFLERPDVKGNLDRSIELFKSAIAKDPRFVRAHAALGEAHWRRFKDTGDATAALAARDSAAEAMRLDANDASVRYTLAKIYHDTGRMDGAIEELRTAVRIQPGNDEAHSLLGQYLGQRGELDAGLAEIHKAIGLRPNYWAHHFALGSALFSAGQFANAAAAFRRVTELQPDNGWGFQMLGTSFHAMDDTQNAMVNYRRAIELGHARAYSNLGALLFDERRYAEAASAYEEAIKLEPKSPLKHRMLGDCYARLKDPSRAAPEYRRVIDLADDALATNPKDGTSLSLRAIAEAKLGMSEAALRDAERAVALSPSAADVMFRRAVVLAVSGREPDSLAALEAALAHGYSISLARRDPDLENLRKRSDFASVVGRHQPAAASGGGH
jgi:serine/threonine-protein kinase